jgi:hypothetical protein
MRNDVKRHYERHFGVFDPLSLSDIDEINQYELNLVMLPDVFFKLPARSITAYLPVNRHKELQTILQTVLNLTNN